MSNFGRGDDLGSIQRRSYRQSGLSREQRLTITLVVSGLMMLGAGVAIGYAWGRSSVPEPESQPSVQTETTLPAGVVEEVPTDTVETDLAAEEDLASEEATATDEEPPPTPEQTSPKNGARINAARVNLRWTEVEDDSGEPVTYAFEIQDRLSSAEYGNTQVISGLEDTSYSARVLYVTRRWRVWAQDAAGNKSDKSAWRYYRHTPKPPAPKPKPEPSDETT
jgi:hypothetical protein